MISQLQRYQFLSQDYEEIHQVNDIIKSCIRTDNLVENKMGLSFLKKTDIDQYKKQSIVFISKYTDEEKLQSQIKFITDQISRIKIKEQSIINNNYIDNSCLQIERPGDQIRIDNNGLLKSEEYANENEYKIDYNINNNYQQSIILASKQIERPGDQIKINNNELFKSEEQENNNENEYNINNNQNNIMLESLIIERPVDQNNHNNKDKINDNGLFKSEEYENSNNLLSNQIIDGNVDEYNSNNKQVIDDNGLFQSIYAVPQNLNITHSISSDIFTSQIIYQSSDEQQQYDTRESNSLLVSQTQKIQVEVKQNNINQKNLNSEMQNFFNKFQDTFLIPELIQQQRSTSLQNIQKLNDFKVLKYQIQEFQNVYLFSKEDERYFYACIMMAEIYSGFMARNFIDLIRLCCFLKNEKIEKSQNKNNQDIINFFITKLKQLYENIKNLDDQSISQNILDAFNEQGDYQGLRDASVIVLRIIVKIYPQIYNNEQLFEDLIIPNDAILKVIQQFFHKEYIFINVLTKNDEFQRSLNNGKMKKIIFLDNSTEIGFCILKK